MLRRVALTFQERIASIIRVLRLLVTANIRSSSILVTLMTEAIRSTKTSVLTRATAFFTVIFVFSKAVFNYFYLSIVSYSVFIILCQGY
jgi:hypothetical protein